MNPTSFGGDQMALLVERLRRAGCVFAEDEAALLSAAADDADKLERLVARRCAGEPLEYVLGWAEFCGIRVAVGSGVFVPRQRTRVLATQAIAVAREITERPPVVLDLCCGTGAIAAVVSAGIPGAEVYASDLDPAAVAYARRNLPGGTVFQSDLFAAIPDSLRSRVGVLTVNAPYVPTSAIAFMPPEARLYEHRIALDGGSDGLDLQRRIIAEAPDWLTSSGHLLVESSLDQAPVTALLMREVGLVTRVVHDDEVDGTAVIGGVGPSTRMGEEVTPR
jgi:release factor glutamine methyltransferase